MGSGNANIHWAACSPSSILYTLVSTLNGTSHASDSTTNACIGTAASGLSLPPQIYGFTINIGSGGEKCGSPNYAIGILEG